MAFGKPVLKLNIDLEVIKEWKEDKRSRYEFEV